MMNTRSLRIVFALAVAVILIIGYGAPVNRSFSPDAASFSVRAEGPVVEVQASPGEPAYPLPPTPQPPEEGDQAGGGYREPAYPPPTQVDEPSPLPSPVPLLPTPTPELSPIAQRALAHVVRLYGPSAEDLVLEAEELVKLPLTEREYWWVLFMDPVAVETYRVAVDGAGELVDAAALEQQERDAYRARYGKLDPALYDLLQGDGEDDATIRVAIWLNDIDQPAIDRQIKERYADVPLEGVRPSAETPRGIYDTIYQERRAAQAQAYRQSNGALADAMRNSGYTVSFVSRAAPLVFASVPRSAIASLAERPDVQTIFLEREYQPHLETAGRTDEADVVWGKGYDGSGIRVAIVERAGVDFGHPDLAAGLYYDALNPQIDIGDYPGHSTFVAGCVASTSAGKEGVAHGAFILSANTGTFDEQDVIAATEWAIGAGPSAQGQYLWEIDDQAWVLNHSYGIDSGGTLTALARYLDHVTFSHFRTNVASAGNEASYVNAPALAHNVIAVGGTNDNETRYWADDAMWNLSSFVNPIDLREKPDVAAVAQHVNVPGLYGGWEYWSGTSLAAPQVAGLAALLLDRDWALHSWPMTVKAVIMASAVHNIEGDRRLSDKDGAGAIDAALADDIVANDQYFSQLLTPGHFDGGGWKSYDFTTTSGERDLVRGERVRIALVWNSHPDNAHPPTTDPLLTNLDLRVRKPNGSLLTVAGSLSTSLLNSFEILDFIVPETGDYDIMVKKEAFNAVSEYVGIAWGAVTEDYIPLLASSASLALPSGTWAHGLQVQNLSDQTAHIVIEFIWAMGEALEGQVAVQHRDEIPAGQSEQYYLPSHIPGMPQGFKGSAVIRSDRPIRSIANTKCTSQPFERLASVGGIVEWATAYRAPYLRKDYFGRNSCIAIQNLSPEAVSVVVDYYEQGSANRIAQDQTTIAPYATRVLYQAQQPGLPAGFHGSAVISAPGPVAAVVLNSNSAADYTSAGLEAYDAIPVTDAANILRMPKLTVNYYGYQSSFTVQNVGSSNAIMTVYYNFGGTQYSKTSPSIPPNSIWPVYLATEYYSGIPQGFMGTGSGRIESNQPVVGIVTEAQLNNGYAVVWNATPEGASTDTILFPKFDRWYYDYNGGIQIQNLVWLPTRHSV